jgi:hypothetical protein
MLALPTTGIARSVNVHNVELDALCDWIEASVLFSGDPRVSGSEVVDALCEGEIYDSQSFAWERISDAWRLLNKRHDWLGAGAPYSMEPQSIKRTKTWKQACGYSFCLVLSLARLYPAWASTFGSDYTDQGAMFEELTKTSLERILPGWQIHQTGWTRKKPSKLKAVVEEVARLLGETAGDVPRWAPDSSNEAGLDLLCFRPFHDKRVGIPVYLLQCASGRDWTDKLKTPDLDVWNKIVVFTAKPRRAFAMPFAPPPEEFIQACARVDGMLLDRYRLMSAGRDKDDWLPMDLQKSIVAWLGPRIKKLPLDSQ